MIRGLVGKCSGRGLGREVCNSVIKSLASTRGPESGSVLEVTGRAKGKAMRRMRGKGRGWQVPASWQAYPLTLYQAAYLYWSLCQGLAYPHLGTRDRQGHSSDSAEQPSATV